MPGLTAFVPDTMVKIDDSQQQAPNMYDGLSRHAKVLYLLTTLDSSQWNKVTGVGLGASDLTKDQGLVFQSLLPKPFEYFTAKVGSKGYSDNISKTNGLSDSDRQSVRLKVERGLEFMMPIIGQPRSMTPRSTSQDTGDPGQEFKVREDRRDFEPQDSFGMKIRQVVENVQKPSELRYSEPNLGATITLKPIEKISDLLSRIGSQVGLELHADFRVGDRPLASIGQSAPMSSVLRAVALAVTGTYRRVGTAYELTSDLIGLGTRKMKLAIVDDALNAKAFAEEQVWRHQIFLSGHLADFKFRIGDQNVPDDNLLQKVKQFDNGDREPTLTTAEMSGALRSFIDRQNRMYRTQPVTFDGARVNSEYLFSFLLPNGEPLRPETDRLGEHSSFANAQSNQNQAQQPPDTPKVNVQNIRLPVSLSLVAETPDEAEAAVDLAARFGIQELWLDTFNQTALHRAIDSGAKMGVRVALAVRPFDYRSKKDDAYADRTLIGDTPPEALNRRIATRSGYDNRRADPEQSKVGPISPVSAGFKARLALIANLVKASGLAGVRIFNVAPNGYNGPRAKYRGSLTPIFQEMGNFGYCEDLRLEFLRKSSVDPIDLAPKDLSTNSDLRQPFFLDDALRGSWAIYDGTDNPHPLMAGMMDTFDAWLAMIDRSAIQSLLDRIIQSNPTISISVEPVVMTTNAVNRGGDTVEDWKPGSPLPQLADAGGQQQTPGGQGGILRMSVNAATINYVPLTLTYMARPNAKFGSFNGIALEFTSMDLKDAAKWMSSTFVPAVAK